MPANADLPACSDVREEDGNRQLHTCIAELCAPNGTELPDAAIDAHCVRITLRDAGLAAGTTEGLPIMRFALNRRNSSITEANGNSSRMAAIKRTVKLQVISPVQVWRKPGQEVCDRRIAGSDLSSC